MYNKSDRHRSGNSVRDIVEGLNRKQREGKGRGRQQTGDRINARQAGSRAGGRRSEWVNRSDRQQVIKTGITLGIVGWAEQDFALMRG